MPHIFIIFLLFFLILLMIVNKYLLVILMPFLFGNNCFFLCILIDRLLLLFGYIFLYVIDLSRNILLFLKRRLPMITRDPNHISKPLIVFFTRIIAGL